MIIDFEIGTRWRSTFKKLWKRLQEHKVDVYFSDEWEAYVWVLPDEKHIAHKSWTCAIEWLNNLIRHFIARFHRKTHCYSKCVQMVKYTLYLFMYQKFIISIFT